MSKTKATISVDAHDYQLLKRILKKNGQSISSWFYYQMTFYLDQHLWQLLDDPELDLTEGEKFAARRSNNENAIPWVGDLIYQIQEDDSTYTEEG